VDILHLIDRLEELLNQSRPLWFTHNVIVDEDRILDLIDQMRVAIPEEVKKAQQIVAQKNRIMAQAQEEANRTVAIAKEKQEQHLERDAIVQAAQARADEILNNARLEVENTRHQADEYVIDTLRRLEVEMDRYLNQVRNGILSLQRDQPGIGSDTGSV